MKDVCLYLTPGVVVCVQADSLHDHLASCRSRSSVMPFGGAKSRAMCQAQAFGHRLYVFFSNAWGAPSGRWNSAPRLAFASRPAVPVAASFSSHVRASL